MAQAHGHHEDNEWRGLFAMAIIMPILASILGVLATQADPAGPGPGEPHPGVHAPAKS